MATIELVCFYHFERCPKRKFPRGISCKHIFFLIFFFIVITCTFPGWKPVQLILGILRSAKNYNCFPRNLNFAVIIFTKGLLEMENLLVANCVDKCFLRSFAFSKQMFWFLCVISFSIGREKQRRKRSRL